MTININGFPCVLADGVRETTQTSGTGTYSLDGAVTIGGITYRSFVEGVGDNNSTVYTVRHGDEWEIGIGTVSDGAPPTLTRDVILKSSNSDDPVSWGSNDPKDIFVGAVADAFHNLQDQIDTAVVALAQHRIFSQPGEHTYTPDPKTLFVRVICVGGGGAGGGAAATTGSQNAVGGGGGGGGYAERFLPVASILPSVTVTVGAGGSGVAGADGGNGGASSFGTLVVATGGQGGTAGGATTNALGNGGAGGAGTTGHVLLPGGTGGGGFATVAADGSTVRIWSGFGGDSVLATVTHRNLSGSNAHHQGTAGRAVGGGGAGSANNGTQTALPGGNGASGLVLIEEFLHR